MCFIKSEKVEMKITPNSEVLILLNSYNFYIFPPLHSILANLKVSKKFKRVSL